MSVETGVRWSMLHGTHKCDDCHTVVLPGERMATYDDVTVSSRSWKIPPDHDHKILHFCEPCGKLLEDSLTTTEMC
jgi:hypothetical protein